MYSNISSSNAQPMMDERESPRDLTDGETADKVRLPRRDGRGDEKDMVLNSAELLDV